MRNNTKVLMAVAAFGFLALFSFPNKSYASVISVSAPVLNQLIQPDQPFEMKWAKSYSSISGKITQYKISLRNSSYFRLRSGEIINMGDFTPESSGYPQEAVWIVPAVDVIPDGSIKLKTTITIPQTAVDVFVEEGRSRGFNEIQIQNLLKKFYLNIESMSNADNSIMASGKSKTFKINYVANPLGYSKNYCFDTTVYFSSYHANNPSFLRSTENIYQLQLFLKKLMSEGSIPQSNLTVSGKYDWATQAALAEYQKSKGILPTEYEKRIRPSEGHLNVETRKAINEVSCSDKRDQGTLNLSIIGTSANFVPSSDSSTGEKAIFTLNLVLRAEDGYVKVPKNMTPFSERRAFNPGLGYSLTFKKLVGTSLTTPKPLDRDVNNVKEEITWVGPVSGVEESDYFLLSPGGYVRMDLKVSFDPVEYTDDGDYALNPGGFVHTPLRDHRSENLVFVGSISDIDFRYRNVIPITLSKRGDKGGLSQLKIFSTSATPSSNIWTIGSQKTINFRHINFPIGSDYKIFLVNSSGESFKELKSGDIWHKDGPGTELQSTELIEGKLWYKQRTGRFNIAEDIPEGSDYKVKVCVYCGTPEEISDVWSENITIKKPYVATDTPAVVDPSRFGKPGTNWVEVARGDLGTLTSSAGIVRVAWATDLDENRPVRVQLINSQRTVTIASGKLNKDKKLDITPELLKAKRLRFPNNSYTTDLYRVHVVIVGRNGRAYHSNSSSDPTISINQ